MDQSQQPFLGSAALADGRLNRHALRSRYRPVFPDVYVPRGPKPALSQRIAAATLWAGPTAVVAGSAASALHGSRWVDDDVPIELIHDNPRAPHGIISRRDTLLDGEVLPLAGLGGTLVTTPARTAFDLGRRDTVRRATARLDALTRATGLAVPEVAALAEKHPRTRGLVQLAVVLSLVDPGAESPQETYLRLLLIDAGLRPAGTQIPVHTEEKTYYLDMGWRECLVAVEYEGRHHQDDRDSYVYDVYRLEVLQSLGWLVIRVVAEDDGPQIVERVRRALASRGYRVR